MGIFSKPKPPPVTNYNTVAGQQAGANLTAGQQTLGLNTINQTNPYGSLSYSLDPSTGRYTANQSLSAAQQQLLDYLQGTQASAGSQAQGLMGNVDYSQPANLGDMASGLTSQQLAAYTQYNQPYYTKALDALDNKLRNSGLVPGNPEYDYEMMALRNQQSNQQSAAAAQFEPQAFSQALQQYQLPALMAQSLAQFGSPNSVIQNLWSTPQTQVNPTDYIGANANMNQANMNLYDQQMKNYGAMLSGLSGIATGGLQGYMGMLGRGGTSGGGVG